MFTKKQSEETFDESNPAFSMIADFDGNENGLFDSEMDEVVPILPLRNMVLFPTVVMPVTVGRKSSLKLIQNASADGKQIAVFCQKDPDTENPGFNDLYSVGVLAKVIRVFDMPDQTTTVVLQGMQRIKLRSIISDSPYLVGSAELFPEVLPPTRSKEFKAIVDSCKDAAVKYVKLSDNIQPDAAFALKNISNGLFLINFICANLPFDIKEKARLLREGTCSSRALSLLSLLNREIQLAELKMSIQRRTHEDIDKQQKEYFLQQELKNIQDELGGSVQDQDIEEMRLKAGQKKWSPEVRKIFDKELVKLERTNSQSPDYNVQLSYLQTVLSLPWGEYTKDNLDMDNARKALDKDHYGLEKVKERILEHLAVMKLRGDFKSPILCLYGPPGVGKTSLGLSIANALKRKYVRISLGGLHDEAEIRGHRKTYIGAMPGRIIKGLAKAGSSNPVFILDEIDKVSQMTTQGDPSSAMLEVLDPEQNNAFHDNYLDIDYDLSKVMFIATANNLNTIPAPLLDRMEIIEVSGYITEEKIEIARRHLIPKEMEANGLKKGSLTITKPAIEAIIESYTRESGVRELEKKIGKVCRKAACRYADNAEFSKMTVKPDDLKELLGTKPYSRDKYQGNDYAGVVTGLAWTAVGGEILFVAWGFPATWKFDNYALIFQMENFNVLEMFGNTLILSIAIPTMSCLSTVLAAYVMAKFKFRGHGILYAIYLIPMLVAITGTTSSLYMLIDSWGLIGSYTGIIIMAASGTGMNFLLVYSLFKNVDDAYMEAARIDGASEFRIFGQIMLPHAMGLVGTLWVLGFIGSWNDYATPKIFLGGDKYTIATGLEKIGNMVETADPIMMQNYPAYFAAIILSILPIVIIFFIFQKQIMKISLGGGIK